MTTRPAGLLYRLMNFQAGPPVSLNAPTPWDDFWYSKFAPGTTSGPAVTEDNALQLSIVYTCIKVIAETLAVVPLVIYKRNANGKGRTPARDLPLFKKLRARPNRWQTSFEWREMMQGHILLRGNGYNLIKPGADGAVDQLIPLRPDRMTPKMLPNGEIAYFYRPPGTGQVQVFLREEILHLRGLSSDGIVGLSPVQVARETIGLGMATESYGARFFANSANPSGVLEHPGELDTEAHDRLLESWVRAHSGANQHQPAILEEGMKWHQLTMPSKDAQFLETRQFQRREIAAIYRVQPHKVGDIKDTSFNTIEQLSIEFVQDTMLSWFERWEQTLERDLLTEAQQEDYEIEFNVDALLRGDIKSRFEAYQIALLNGILSDNEVREREGLNPRDGGDEYRVPMNTAPSGGDPQQPGGKLAAPQQAPKQLPAGAPPPAKRSGAAKALLVAKEHMLADAVERIAAAERREVQARWKALHGNGDRARFAAWAGEFYEQHAGYVARTLTPIIEAWKLSADPAAAAKLVASSGLTAVLAFKHEDDTAAWAAGRHDALTAILKELT